MSNIKMIVTDLDGTLLRKDRSISEYSRNILRKCHQRGIMVVVATARPERATTHLRLHGFLSYVIANNGATITLDGKRIRNITIPEDVKHSLIKRLVTDRAVSNIVVETGDFLFTNDKNHMDWCWDADWNPVVTDFLTPVKEEACKLFVECGSPGFIAGIERDYPDIHILSDNAACWYQIMHRTVSKFNAISFLSEKAGIAPQDIMAFGDDYNDVEMLKNCGVGVAAGNAVADAKQAADFICGTNDSDGVAEYLEKHLL
jgi:Cof subfamily protein (haloacid dehalogenase superfamily)